jgi:hypothetical protein
MKALERMSKQYQACPQRHIVVSGKGRRREGKKF